MSSPLRRASSSLLAVVAAALTAACTAVDYYPREPAADAAADAAVDAAEDAPAGEALGAACLTCMAAQCAPEKADCEGDPDCLACETDPHGAACARSAKRRPLRDCACVDATCLGVCGPLCPNFGHPLPPPPEKVSSSPDCVRCVAAKCPVVIDVCVPDPECFACTSDLTNPACMKNAAWVKSVDCLCFQPRKCVDECGCLYF